MLTFLQWARTCFPCNWYLKSPILKFHLFWKCNWLSIWKMTDRVSNRPSKVKFWISGPIYKKSTPGKRLPFALNARRFQLRCLQSHTVNKLNFATAKLSCQFQSFKFTFWYTMPLMIHVWFRDVAPDAWFWNIAPDVWLQNIAPDARQTQLFKTLRLTPARHQPDVTFRNQASGTRFQNHAPDVTICDHASDVQYESGYVPQDLSQQKCCSKKMLVALFIMVGFSKFKLSLTLERKLCNIVCDIESHKKFSWITLPVT